MAAIDDTYLKGLNPRQRDAVLQTDGPVLVLMRGGESMRITRSIGPERITARWWLAPAIDAARPKPPAPSASVDGGRSSSDDR